MFVSLTDMVSERGHIRRREILRFGGFGAAALTAALTGVSRPLRAAVTPTEVATGKSVIFLFMQGGPPQHETFDPKLDAPAEIATVGGAIASSVPGLALGESLPGLAKLAHRLAFVRNYATGTQHGKLEPIVSGLTHDASIGAVYSRVAGTNHPRTGLPRSSTLWPKSVDADQPGPHDRFGRFHATGALGAGHTPFTPGAGGPLQESLTLTLPRDRFQDRRQLLASLDKMRRKVDDAERFGGLDDLQKQSAEMILNGLGDAFDLSQEDPHTLAHYDTSHYNTPQLLATAKAKAKDREYRYVAHAQTLGKLLLLARRLCEAGCGFVTINTEFVWDFHQDTRNVGIVEGKKMVIQPFDHAVSAFIRDCDDRRLSDQILLVCAGEMGRTPKLNKGGGRDHWPSLAPLMLYGGGLTSGQAIGESTRDGGSPIGEPLKPDDLAATIFHTLFDFGQVRLLPDLPAELKQTFTKLERMPGVLQGNA